MTLRNAEKITGLTITFNGRTATGFNDSGAEVVYACDPQLKHALDGLVKKNWARVCQIVFTSQERQCFDCGRLKPLSGHHEVFRSHGRRDVPENVRGLCAECHEARHGRRK